MRTLVYGYACVQILYYYSPAQKVFKYAPVTLVKAHKVRGHADKAIHIAHGFFLGAEQP